MDFAPVIDTFLKEHLFGAVFGRDILTYQQRELITVSALAAMEGVEAQLESYLTFAMNTGLTASQLSEAFNIIERNIGKQQADKGNALLSKAISKK